MLAFLLDPSCMEFKASANPIQVSNIEILLFNDFCRNILKIATFFHIKVSSKKRPYKGFINHTNISIRSIFNKIYPWAKKHLSASNLMKVYKNDDLQVERKADRRTDIVGLVHSHFPN